MVEQQTVKVDTSEMEAEARRSVGVLGPPVSMTKEPGATRKFSNAELLALVEKTQHPALNPFWFVVAAISMAFGFGLVYGLRTKPIPVLPPPVALAARPAISLVAPEVSVPEPAPSTKALPEPVPAKKKRPKSDLKKPLFPLVDPWKKRKKVYEEM